MSTALRPLAVAALVLLVSLSTQACSAGRITTPDRMAELAQPSWSPYDYRAASPDGVILAWRAVRMERGDVPLAGLDFWQETLRLRLRDVEGYALLDERDVTSANGHPGVELDFGRDEEGQTWRYRVRVYATSKFVHLVEAGAEQSLFEREEAVIESALGSYEVRR